MCLSRNVGSWQEISISLSGKLRFGEFSIHKICDYFHYQRDLLISGSKIAEWRIKKTHKDSSQMQATQILTTVIVTVHRKLIIIISVCHWECIIITTLKCTISDRIHHHYKSNTIIITIIIIRHFKIHLTLLDIRYDEIKKNFALLDRVWAAVSTHIKKWFKFKMSKNKILKKVCKLLDEKKNGRRREKKYSLMHKKT